MVGHRIQRTEDDIIKEAMHEMPYGIYVIGTTADGRANGMIADWVMQVSFSPRLVAVAFERDSTSLQRIRANGYFTVNLLNQEGNGMALAAKFVQPSNPEKVKGRTGDASVRQPVDKLAGVDTRLSERAPGCPILEDALAFLECQSEQILEVGDHFVVIGRVLYGEVQQSGEPLTSTYTGWSYSG